MLPTLKDKLEFEKKKEAKKKEKTKKTKILSALVSNIYF